VVVNDLNLLGAGVGPHEADPPLVIDPDAVLPDTIALERLESVARWDPKIVEHLCGTHLAKLPERNPLDPKIDRPHSFPTPQSLGIPVAERPDHRSRV
jgi:hypothetical protein